jgi:ATP-binding cassette subfamily B protein
MENILYGCSGATPDDVRSFITENGLTDIFRLYDLGDRAGRGGENLSGGMRQVVLLMRCYFRNCPIVILDEATSSIDARHRTHAIIIIRRMFDKKTVIAVSHDSDIMGLFDRRLVFSPAGVRVEAAHPASSSG